MLDLRRLEMLHRFAVLGSITAAAIDLGYSPSAVSQQLTTLEREAGIALLERTAHSAALTAAGRELAEHAVAVLSAVETADSRMRALAGTVGGHVEVSCIPGLAVRLAPHLAAAQATHPALTIVARETDAVAAATAVLDGRCDLAVVDDWTAGPGTAASGLTVHDLQREAILLAVPLGHPRARSSATIAAPALRDLVENHTWLCAPTGQVSRTASDIRLEAMAISPRRRWEFGGLHVLASLVAAGAGIAFLPAGIIANQPGLSGLALRPGMRRRVIALTRSSRQQDPALVSCLNAARAAFRRNSTGAVPGAQ